MLRHNSASTNRPRTAERNAMPTSVKMLNNVFDASRTLLAVGTTLTLADDLAAALVGRGDAVDVGAAFVRAPYSGIDRNIIELTQAQIDTPTAAILAATNLTFQLSVAPRTRYRSDGTALVSLGATKTPGLNTMGAVAVHASIATTGTNVGTNAGLGRLMCNQYMAFGPFVGVRLIFANFDTVAASLVNACAVASAGVNRTQGNTLAWSPLVTFDGGASTSKSIPAATASAHNSAGLVISDFIPVNSLARTDGGTLPILQVQIGRASCRERV